MSADPCFPLSWLPYSSLDGLEAVTSKTFPVLAAALAYSSSTPFPITSYRHFLKAMSTKAKKTMKRLVMSCHGCSLGHR